MNSIAKIISPIALAVTLVPCVLYFFGMLAIEPMKWIALAGTIAWFVATPMWMGRDVQVDDSHAKA